jgi:hypothetical protein
MKGFTQLTKSSQIKSSYLWYEYYQNSIESVTDSMVIADLLVFLNLVRRVSHVYAQSGFIQKEQMNRREEEKY